MVGEVSSFLFNVECYKAEGEISDIVLKAIV